MNETLARQCELLVENRKLLSKAFLWNFDVMTAACAALVSADGRPADVGSMKECSRIIKREKSIFSDFRSHLNLAILTKMALSGNPEQYFSDLVQVNKMFPRNKLIGSDYRLLAAVIICDRKGLAGAQGCIDRCYEIYDAMRKQHPLLTSAEDLPLAALLAAENVTGVELLIDEMERCYPLIKKRFHHNEAAQSCSHVMALVPGDAQTKCSRLFEVWDKLKAAGHKYGKDMEIGVLSALCALDVPADEIVRDICDADDYLKKQKGFGGWSIGKRTRRMFAALMTIHAHAERNEAGAGESVAMTVALEICIMIVIMICASSAAAASSSANH